MIPRLLIAIFVALSVSQGRADDPAADSERVCRNHLQQLAEAVKSYRLLHDGKSPPHLSDLYYESYADDITLYRCPAVGTARLLRTEIDAKSDYTTEPLPGHSDVLVRERESHHGQGTVLAAMEDGSVKAIALGAEPSHPLQPADPFGRGLPIDSSRGATSQPVRPTDPVVAKTNEPKVTDPARPASRPSDNNPQITLLDADQPFGNGTATRSTRQPPPGVKVGGEDLPPDVTRLRSGSVTTIRGTMDAKQTVQIADSLFKQKAYDAADEFYRRALEAEPQNKQALLGGAQASMETGSLHMARSRYLGLIEQEPANLEAQQSIAKIDLALGETAKATAAADALLKEHPDDWNAIILRAQCALYAGDDAGAQKFLHAASHDLAKAAKEQSALAEHYQDQRVFRLSLLHYTTAVALDPSDELSLLNLAVAATRLGEKQRAIKAYNEFLRRHPGNDPPNDYIREELRKLEAPSAKP